MFHGDEVIEDHRVGGTGSCFMVMRSSMGMGGVPCMVNASLKYKSKKYGQKKGEGGEAVCTTEGRRKKARCQIEIMINGKKSETSSFGSVTNPLVVLQLLLPTP